MQENAKNANNETNHLQNLYTHVHYNKTHTHICTVTFIAEPYFLVPVFVEFVTSLVASGISDEIHDTAACLLTFNSSHCHEPEYVSDMLIHRTIHD